MTIKSETTNFYGKLEGMSGVHNHLSLHSALERPNGTLGAIDTPAVMYASRTGNHKNLVCELNPKCK
ncbi:MAG TPA: hypothetical protein VFI73_05655 [Candidatus Nitrosopolaris sp.]|nr:hypothetical protein [Candidatus Nitrosopolaris sp.]